MKKTIVNGLLIGFAGGVFGQGEIFLDNFNNGDTNPLATASGLFWLSTGGTPVLINQEFNAAFYGGVTSNSLSLLAIFLLSNGTAAHDNPFPGIFLDPTGNSYPVPGTFLTGFFQIQAWTGNFSSYATAAAAGAPAAQSPIFMNPVRQPPGPPPDLVAMPAIVLSGIPEPSTFALAALGGLCALMLRKRLLDRADL